MALIGVNATGAEPAGTTGTQTRPINEGNPVTVSGTQQQSVSQGLWDWLDGVAGSVQSGVSQAVNNKVDSLVKKTTDNPKPDSTGNPNDNPQQVTPTAASQPFAVKYKTQLLWVAGALAAGLIINRLAH